MRLARDKPAEILLTTWAARRFPDKPPSIHTLRRWVREQKIYPRPVKTGREYRVAENAVYVNWNDPESREQISDATSTQ